MRPPDGWLPSAGTLDERLIARLTDPTPARAWVLDTLTRASERPDHATHALREAGRDARRLRSRERRALFDVVHTMIRYERALGGLDGRALDAWLAGRWPDDASLGVWAGVPDPIGDALHRDLGDRAWDWLAASNARAPTYLRAHGVDAAALARRLTADGLPCRAVEGRAIVLEGPGNVVGHPAFREGRFEVQDLGSQRVAAFVDGSGRTVLDLCAGAGGKALALHDLGARVTAADVRRRALDELGHRASRAGARVEVVHLADGTPSALGDRRFARVLVDAPCSGSGVWRRHPEHRWRLRAPDALDRLTALQRRLLVDALSLAEPGGRVVYATCSSIRAENTGVVDAVLADHPSWTRAGPDLVLQPHVDGTDGMFASALVPR